LSLRSNPGLELANAFGVFNQFQTTPHLLACAVSHEIYNLDEYAEGVR
jgi:hypothetical protein